jgi:hypothetical protein
LSPVVSLIEWVEQRKFRDPLKVLGVSRDQRVPVEQGGGGDEGVSERHFLRLPEFDGPLQDGLREGKTVAAAKNFSK